MLDKVEDKIRELRKMQREEYYKKKESDLENWGLTTRKTGNKTAPLVVTDEEYEALVKASSGVGMPTRNRIARVLNVASLCFLSFGIIVGFALLSFIEELGWVYLIASVLVGIFGYLLFRGVAEAVALLQQLVDSQLTASAQRSHAPQEEFPSEQPDVASKLTDVAAAEKADDDFYNA